MTYQEKRSLVNVLTTLLMMGVYGWFMWERRPLGEPYAPEVFLFWGRFFVILIPATIALSIVNHILFAIFDAAATGEMEPGFTDERDMLIDLRSSRVSGYVLGFGVMVAMGLLALGQPPTAMFVAIFLAGALSTILGDLLAFVYYRRGL